jgi:hypothetical protein
MRPQHASNDEEKTGNQACAEGGEAVNDREITPYQRIAELERENAALRADEERLDWLQTLDCDSHWWFHIANSAHLRAVIDAARKEQP